MAYYYSGNFSVLWLKCKLKITDVSVLIYIYVYFRCAFEKSLCSKYLVVETDTIECERILNLLYNNYLKECAENKYKIPDLQNRLKTLISFQETNNLQRRESVRINNFFSI